ncbi:MAG: hydroxymethylbilane synthase [Desulfobacterales bacterium]|nr:MAG: hydroxymethylbilane synthase [Desulfobacterales bacterium]
MNPSLKIGTRGSQLALWQANWVKAAFAKKFPHQALELVVIKTQGDKILDVPLAAVGGKGLFVKEIEQALLDRRIDLAVHSMKDMPSDIPEELCLGAVPEREDPTDVLISKSGRRLAELGADSVIGTSSLRRAAQLRHARPDIRIIPLRGNLDTRLRKLDTETIDAIVLAAAGVKRLGLDGRVTEYLDHEIMLPAVGQGALYIEIRQNDPVVGPLVNALDHAHTRAVVMGERAFLKRLEGGCQVPIAGHGHIEQDRFTLQGLVAHVDGAPLFRASLSGAAVSSERIGVKLAEALLAKGADKILEQLKSVEPANYAS